MFTPKQYAAALFEAVSQTNPKDQDKILDNFVKILAENGDAHKFAEIEEEYNQLDKAAKGTRTVEITTAREDLNAKQIVGELNRVLGSKTEIKHTVDQGIIGGAVLRSGEFLLDASIKKILADLRNTIKN